MARTIKDASLDSRTARDRLKSRNKPYFRSVEPGLHLGYRRATTGSGKWIARYYIGNQTYTTETLATADDNSDPDGVEILSYGQALTLARAKREKRALTKAGKIAKPMKVKEVTDDYFDYLRSEGQDTYNAIHRDKAFIRPKLGDMEVNALTAQIIRNWHRALANAPALVRSKKGEKQRVKPTADTLDAHRARKASANRILTILKAALNRAFEFDDHNRIASDTAWRKVKPFKNVAAARPRFLSVEEARRLINACPTDFRKLVHGALQTGARYGELCRLTVGDFQRDSEKIEVRFTKSGSPRHIILTAEGLAFFRTLTAGRKPDERMFLRSDGEPWAASHQNRPMATACKRAKIAHIGFHGLRHTWASLAYKNGLLPLIIAGNLGHADTRMVEAHYGHLAQDFRTEGIRAKAPKFGMVRPTNVRTMERRAS